MSRRGKVVGESKAYIIWLTHTKTSEDVRFAVHHILRNVYVVEVSYLLLSMLNLRNVYCSRDDDKVIRST